MSKSTNGLRKAGLASLAVTLTLGAGFVAAGSASAVEDFKFDRFDGDNRYHTSTLVADEYNETNPHVILAPGEHGKYADALTANYLSGSLDAPILLTRQDFTPKPVLAQLEEDNTERITIVGGNASVSTEQEAALVAAGYTVNRLSGADRFATNAEVIESVETDAVDGTGLIATGFNFADALAGGPVTYQGHPLGLSTQDDIEQDVIDALKGAGVTQVYILGGETVVGPEVAAKLEANDIDVAGRLAGANRAATSVEIAEFAIENLDFVDTHVGVASGYVEGSGADALAGGPLEGTETAPMLVTRNERNPGEVTDFIEANCDTIDTGHVYGGQVAITAAAEAEMTEAAQCDAPASNQDFTVTPAEAATNDFSGTAAGTENRGQRAYSVSGLDDTKTYDVFLFPAEYVTDTNGVISFRDTEGSTVTTDDNNVADWAATEAVIESVNNTAVTTDNNGSAMDLAAVNGVLKFTIDSDAVDQVIPVIFLDADNNSGDAAPDLDLDANNQPTELFAIGGQKNWIAPQAAASADAADGRVVSLDKAANRFSIDDAATAAGDYAAGDADLSFFYDSNDTFRLGGVPATFEEFEANLSRGDFVDVGAYSQNAALVSSFDIEVDTPEAPTSVNADAGASGQATNDITVVTDPSSPNNPALYDSFVIQRAPVVGGTTGTYATVKTLTPAEDEDTSATTITWTDMNVPAGTYMYRVAGVIDGDQGEFKADTATVSSTNPGADTQAPLSVDAVVTTNAGLGGTFDTGDVFKVVFNEAMAAPNAGDTIRARDESGANDTVADFINGTNATFALNASAETVNGVSRAAGTVLTVTLTGAPSIVAAGDTAGLQIPATVTDQAGNTDVAGNGWSLASGDVVLDQDADDNQSNATDSTDPGVTTAGATAASGTVNFVANEALQSGSVQAADFSSAGNTITGATLGSDGVTITVTFTGASAGDTVVMAVDSVLDLAGNAGPNSTVTANLS